MIIKKDLVIVIIATFCVTVALFSIMPTNSIPPYDPWADIDDNGKLDMIDMWYEASLYGALGDPTKNVKLGYDLQYIKLNYTIYPDGSASYGQMDIFCGGYSRLSLLVTPINISENVGTYTITLYIGWLQWFTNLTLPNAMNYELVGLNGFNVTIDRFFYAGEYHINWISSFTPFTSATKAPYCLPTFHYKNYTNLPPDGLWMEFDVCAYLRNE